MQEPSLAYLLLRAGRWFDAMLREGLAARGWPRLTAAQSLVFASLDAAGTPPASLARALGTTRQATSDLVAGLVRLDLLVLSDDAARRRGRLIRLTARGEALVADAGVLLGELEESWGSERARRLRDLLAEPIAEPPAIEPAAAEPAVAEPVVAEPVVAEPAMAEPAMAEPAVAEPVVAEPAVAEPAFAGGAASADA